MQTTVYVSLRKAVCKILVLKENNHIKQTTYLKMKVALFYKAIIIEEGIDPEPI